MPVLTLEYTRSIQAPPTQVWGVIVDLDDYPEWNPFVTRCASELSPGAPIAMSVNMGMFTTEQTEQVTRVEAESLFEYRMRPVGKLLYSKRQHRLAPSADGGTCYTSYFELRGWLSPLVGLFMGYFLRRGFSSMTAALVLRAEELAAQS